MAAMSAERRSVGLPQPIIRGHAVRTAPFRRTHAAHLHGQQGHEPPSIAASSHKDKGITEQCYRGRDSHLVKLVRPFHLVIGASTLLATRIQVTDAI